MPGLPVLSGGELVRILSKKYGFTLKKKSGKGSHVRMIHEDGRKTTIPLHSELDRGTLKAILIQAGIDIDEFKQD